MGFVLPVQFRLRLSHSANRLHLPCRRFALCLFQRIEPSLRGVRVHHGSDAKLLHQGHAIGQRIDQYRDACLNGFKEFIERLSQTEHAKHIDVMIVTNGTTDVTKWIDTFSKFRLFEINWSTDGVGSAFEYIRWPGKWEKTREIQTKFNRIVKEKGYTNIVSILTSAIQLLNLDQLPSLLDYCKDAKFDWFSPVLVMWPEPLQLGIAPKHIKQNVIVCSCINERKRDCLITPHTSLLSKEAPKILPLMQHWIP